MIRKMRNQEEIPTPKTKVGKNKLTTRIVRGSDYSPAFELLARVETNNDGQQSQVRSCFDAAHKKIG